MKCTVHDMELMGSNPGRVELGAHSTSKSYLNQNFYIQLVVGIALMAYGSSKTKNLKVQHVTPTEWKQV